MIGHVLSSPDTSNFFEREMFVPWKRTRVASGIDSFIQKSQSNESVAVALHFKFFFLSFYSVLIPLNVEMSPRHFTLSKNEERLEQ